MLMSQVFDQQSRTTPTQSIYPKASFSIPKLPNDTKQLSDARQVLWGRDFLIVFKPHSLSLGKLFMFPRRTIQAHCNYCRIKKTHTLWPCLKILFEYVMLLKPLKVSQMLRVCYQFVFTLVSLPKLIILFVQKSKMPIAHL